MFLIEAEQLQPTQPPQGLAQKNQKAILSQVLMAIVPVPTKRPLTSPCGLRQLTIRKRLSSKYSSSQSLHLPMRERSLDHMARGLGAQT